MTVQTDEQSRRSLPPRNSMEPIKPLNQVPTHRGVMICATTTFLSVLGSAAVFPFMQARRDELGCDALCQGGQTSLRSGLTLIGATLTGRASDRVGRLWILWVGLAASFASNGIMLGMDSMAGMWYSIIPMALFNQNYSVSKALLSDYITERNGADADRAGAAGQLGMAVGFSFMVGPVLTTTLVSGYREAVFISCAFFAASGICMLVLPKPAVKLEREKGSGMMEFLSMPVLKKRGAQLLMVMRLLMALAFHIYIPVWRVSLKERFNFGPRDHSMFMGIVGLSYAFSQGVMSKPLLKRSGTDSTRLVLACILLLGGFRPFALHTSSIWIMYVLNILMVLALGVLNTVITASCTTLATGDQLGGFFGVLESIESAAGVVGPTTGGLLASRHVHLPILIVCGCYSAIFVLVSFFFKRTVCQVPTVCGQPCGMSKKSQ